MADKKISELVSADALSGAELIETVQGGVNKRTTAQDIANLADSGHVIEDEGTPMTARTKLNFVGAGVTVSDDPGDDATVVTIDVLGTSLTGYSPTSGSVSTSDTILSAFNKVGHFIANIAATIRGTVLTGYAVGSNAALAATDTILEAFGKIQAQLNAKLDRADLDRTSVAISSGTLTLDLDSKRQRRFKVSSTVSANFTIALANATNASVFTLDLDVTGTVAITMPSTFRMSQVEADFNNRWNSSTRVLTLTGDTDSPFELSATYDGAIYKLKASQKFI